MQKDENRRPFKHLILLCSYFILFISPSCVSFLFHLYLCISIAFSCLKHNSLQTRLAACGEKHLAVICHGRIKDVAFSCHSIKQRVPASEDAFSLIVPQSLAI